MRRSLSLPRRCLLAAALFSLALVREARAEQAGAVAPDRARLLLPACPELPFDQGDLIASLRAELLGAGIELRPEAPSSPDGLGRAAIISVDSPSCSATDIRIRIGDEHGDQSPAQALDLSDRSLAERGRILALAIAEHLRTSWPALDAPGESAPTPEPPPRETAPRPQQPLTGPTVDDVEREVASLRSELVTDALDAVDRREAAALSRLPRVRLLARILVRSYPLVQGGLLGGHLGASVRLASMLRLDLDVGYGHGGGLARLGAVRVDAVLGGASLLFEGGSSRVRGVVGARLELGWGWARGEPSSAGVGAGALDGCVLSTLVDGGVHVRASEHVWIVLHVVAGWTPVALEPTAEGLRVGGIGRVTLGASLGIALGLGP